VELCEHNTISSLLNTRIKTRGRLIAVFIEVEFHTRPQSLIPQHFHEPGRSTFPTRKRLHYFNFFKANLRICGRVM
jgi:hypothetical protein